MEITKEQKMYAEIVQKAWEDAEFKAKLVANPIATMEEFTGEKLNIPEGKTLIVRDQMDESTIYINLPDVHQQIDNVELTQEQLEMAAGGHIDLEDILTGGSTGPYAPIPTFLSL